MYHARGETYAALLTATDSGLGLLGLLLGLLSRSRSRLRLLSLGLLRLLSLSLLRLLSRGGLLGLLSLLRLLGSSLLLATLRCLTGLQLDDLLSDGDSILLTDKKLLDNTGLRGIHRHVDLTRDRLEFARYSV